MALSLKSVATKNITPEMLVAYAEEISGQSISRVEIDSEDELIPKTLKLSWAFKASKHPAEVYIDDGELRLSKYLDESPSLYSLLSYCMDELAGQEMVYELKQPLPWSEEIINSMDKAATEGLSKLAAQMWIYAICAIAFVTIVGLAIVYGLWGFPW